MKKVMCFGTFDILHEGHRYYLDKARELGDYLVVVIALDNTVKEIKKVKLRNNQEARLKNLQNLKLADKIVLGNPDDKLKIIEDEKPQILCFGYDQVAFTDNIKDKLEKRGISVEVVRVNAYHPDKYKSSIIRNSS